MGQVLSSTGAAIFIGDRIFPLLGYELAEGKEESGLVGQAGRIDFTPRPEAARP